MKLHERVTAETWTQRVAARAADGSPVVNVKDRRAVAWCLMGALERFDRLDRDLPRVADAARALFPQRIAAARPPWFTLRDHDEWAVAHFNDHRATTVEDVLRVLKLADV